MSVQVLNQLDEDVRFLLDNGALDFLEALARNFEASRQNLLKLRKEFYEDVREGRLPDFPAETRGLRESEWQVAPPPADLEARRVEITGPASDRKMVINAFNSGADVYMSDFEDSHSPHWSLTLAGQKNLFDAIRRRIDFTSPEGKAYKLNEDIATLAVRPRGLHLLERNLLVDGQPLSGSLFDFGLFLYHNAHKLQDQGSGPYFYLPKLQNHREAAWWNDVFKFGEAWLGMEPGTIKATVLIEHPFAAFEMEEILYALRDHITGLNLGRWDYIFGFIKTFAYDSGFLLPDRSLVTMEVEFLRSAAEHLVYVTHKRGAHALGGMSAFIPRKDDPEQSAAALANVRADKEREADQGYDGAWVAHPALVPHVMDVFKTRFKDRPHQKDFVPETRTTAKNLLTIPEGPISQDGYRNNVSVGLQYLNAWISGRGAAAIFNLMEDVATAEIARSQLWQWTHHGAMDQEETLLTPDHYFKIRDEELRALIDEQGPQQYAKAVELLDEIVLSDRFVEFLTLPGMKYLS